MGVTLLLKSPSLYPFSDADRLVHAAKRRRVVLCSCHQNRFNKSIQKLREAVEENRFGRLLHGSCPYKGGVVGGTTTSMPLGGELGQADGGALMNQCLHNIDLLRWMMGDGGEEVFAYTSA